MVDPANLPDPKDKKKKVEHSRDDIHFVPAAQVASGQLQRVFMAAPGTYGRTWR